MARSYRRTPILGITTAESEKQDKRRAKRYLRRKVRQGKLYLTLRDVSNGWAFGKDGKRYQADLEARYRRK